VNESVVLQAALAAVERGWSVLPIGRDKRPHLQALVSTGLSRVNDEGKTIGIWAPLQRERPTEEMLRTWFGQPGRGLGVVTGTISGFVGIDYDGEQGRAIAQAWGVSAHVLTRSGGWHQYVEHPGWRVPTLQSQTNTDLKLIFGVDIRADGGYLVMPPTDFAATSDRPRVVYQQLRAFDLDKRASIPDLFTNGGVQGNPREMLSLHAAPVIAVPAPRPVYDRTLSRGDQDDLESTLLEMALTRVFGGRHRNDTGIWLAAQLRDHLLSRNEIITVMEQYQQQVPATDSQGRSDPYTHSEMMGSIYQAMTRPPRDAWWKPKASLIKGRRKRNIDLPPDSEVRASADDAPLVRGRRKSGASRRSRLGDDLPTPVTTPGPQRPDPLHPDTVPGAFSPNRFSGRAPAIPAGPHLTRSVPGLGMAVPSGDDLWDEMSGDDE